MSVTAPQMVVALGSLICPKEMLREDRSPEFKLFLSTVHAYLYSFSLERLQ